MSLHRANVPDWSSVKPELRNRWQRVAAATNGIITPANLISFGGGTLVLYGLYAIVNESQVIGTAAIFIGRIADILDGIVAERTKTKSPLGEAVDATIDKTVLGLGLIALLTYGLLPLLVGLTMAAHGLYNICLTAIGRYRSVKIHPSSAGKLATVVEWFTVGAYLIADLLTTQHNLLHSLVFAIASILFLVYALMAAQSSLAYTRQLPKPAAR